MTVQSQIAEANIKDNIKKNTINDFKQAIRFTIGWDLENIQYLCKTENEQKIFDEVLKLLEKIEDIEV